MAAFVVVYSDATGAMVVFNKTSAFVVLVDDRNTAASG